MEPCSRCGTRPSSCSLEHCSGENKAGRATWMSGVCGRADRQVRHQAHKQAAAHPTQQQCRPGCQADPKSTQPDPLLPVSLNVPRPSPLRCSSAPVETRGEGAGRGEHAQLGSRDGPVCAPQASQPASQQLAQPPVLALQPPLLLHAAGPLAAAAAALLGALRAERVPRLFTSPLSGTHLCLHTGVGNADGLRGRARGQRSRGLGLAPAAGRWDRPHACN